MRCFLLNHSKRGDGRGWGERSCLFLTSTHISLNILHKVLNAPISTEDSTSDQFIMSMDEMVREEEEMVEDEEVVVRNMLASFRIMYSIESHKLLITSFSNWRMDK